MWIKRFFQELENQEEEKFIMNRRTFFFGMAGLILAPKLDLVTVKPLLIMESTEQGLNDFSLDPVSALNDIYLQIEDIFFRDFPLQVYLRKKYGDNWNMTEVISYAAL